MTDLTWGPFTLGDGPDACLLLHGFSGSPHELRPLGEALAARGIRARAPLLPGHGAGPEALLATDRHDLLRAAADELRALQALGPRRLFVAGLSAGALLTLELCASLRRRRGDPEVLAIALLAPAIRFTGSTRLFTRLFGLLPDTGLGLFLDKGRRDLDDAMQPESLPSLPKGLRSDGSTYLIPVAWARQLRLLSAEALAVAPRVRQPALVLHGLLDRTSDLAGSQELVHRLGSRGARLQTFAESGHLLPLDREAAAVCAAVTAFFESVQSADRPA